MVDTRPTVSVAIMSVPARGGAVAELLNQLGEGFPCEVVVDTNLAGPWPTMKHAWEAGTRHTSDYHIVLQDDVWPADHFIEGARDALAVVTRSARQTARFWPPVSFYANRKECEEAAARGDSWVVIPDGTWGQAMALPWSLIHSFLAWEIRHILPDFGLTPRRGIKLADSRMAMWCVRRNTPVWCTVPSLVDHIGAAYSTLGHSPRNRARVVTADARGIDWSAGADNPIRAASALTASYWNYYRE